MLYYNFRLNCLCMITLLYKERDRRYLQCCQFRRGKISLSTRFPLSVNKDFYKLISALFHISFPFLSIYPVRNLLFLSTV